MVIFYETRTFILNSPLGIRQALENPGFSEYNDIIKSLDLSEAKIASINDPRSDKVTILNLSQILDMKKMFACNVRHLNFARCRLMDEDLVLLSGIIIQQYKNVESVNLSDNWFWNNGTVSRDMAMDYNHPVFKAIYDLATWHIKVNITNTNLATNEFLKLFTEEELRFIRHM